MPGHAQSKRTTSTNSKPQNGCYPSSRPYRQNANLGMTANGSSCSYIYEKEKPKYKDAR